MMMMMNPAVDIHDVLLWRTKVDLIQNLEIQIRCSEFIDNLLKHK